ncbi:MAG: toxin HigB [Tepidiphilus sp.]|uniref:type II toxin-antitoxin system RelE/ParE family toxin n=1 Tax=Tepidiphilus succinatimandens TaxID=224436 RepID=UPI00112F70D7|nr:type II toxin-antitoxin system RelE/ParE family toxin [Tepidiphilus succinatimandens]MDK2797506.1 toxin HigB [Tepidiphilus sp.]
MDESQFAHKGLYWFYASGSLKGIQPGHEAKLRRILSALDAAHEPRDLALPGFKLHRLQGDMAGFWAMTVNKNWRVIFRFKDGNICDINYIDYN